MAKLSTYIPYLTFSSFKKKKMTQEFPVPDSSCPNPTPSDNYIRSLSSFFLFFGQFNFPKVSPPTHILVPWVPRLLFNLVCPAPSPRPHSSYQIRLHHQHRHRDDSRQLFSTFLGAEIGTIIIPI